MQEPLWRTLTFLMMTTVFPPTAGADEAYYVPHGLDAPSITRRFLADFAKPGYRFEGLAGAHLVQAHTLLFRARIDDRPLVVEVCVIGSEITLGTTHEWLLMTMFRHPYGPRVGHAEWSLANLEGVHSPIAFRQMAIRPTSKDIQDYLEWSRWDELAGDGFKDIQYLYFPDGWRSLAGSKVIELKDALRWPPKE